MTIPVTFLDNMTVYQVKCNLWSLSYDLCDIIDDDKGATGHISGQI